MTIAVRADDLTVSRGDMLIFSGLSLSLSAGQSLVFTGPNGVGAYSMDLNAPTPFGMHIDPHETWNFQFWFRDPNGPLGSGFNLSNGLKLTFCP